MSGAVSTGSLDPSCSLENAVPGTPTGITIDLGSVMKWPIGVVNAGAGITAGVVDLEGSIDKTTWYKIASSAALSAPGIYVVQAGVAFPARYLRARVSTLTVGGNVTVKVGAGG